MAVDPVRRRERLLRRFERNTLMGMEQGLLKIRFEDDRLQPGLITLHGRSVRNFGLASYLGLNLDPRLKAAAIDAIERYGPVYSSSAVYTAIPLYRQAEERLERVFEAPVIMTPTTTLAHLAALPLLVTPGAPVFLDTQAHESLQLTARVLEGGGSTVTLLPHNDMVALAAALEQVPESAPCMWYLADGVYSMYGDTAPVRDIRALLDEFPRLRVYIDDAHGFGWVGRHGRGAVLDQVAIHERMIVAGSLSKSFGAGGGALVFGDHALWQRVAALGGTLIFSGPLHPAELGALVASADIHLSDEQQELSSRLADQVEATRKMLRESRLPVMASAKTPIWFVRVGSPGDTYEVLRRLIEDGMYVNPAGYPAVPLGSAGLRFANTLFHEVSAYEDLVEALSKHLFDVVGDAHLVVDLNSQAARPSSR